MYLMSCDLCDFKCTNEVEMRHRDMESSLQMYLQHQIVENVTTPVVMMVTLRITCDQSMNLNARFAELHF